MARSDALRTGAVLLALTTLSLPPHIARAEEEDAASLVRTGVQLRRDHRNEEALAAFTKAFDRSPTPTIRAQIALAEQALGRWLDAEKGLDAALSTPDSWITKNRPTLEEARTLIEGHLAWLRVDTNPDDAQVRFASQVLAPGHETRVVAGSGELEVDAAGHTRETRRLLVGAGEHAHEQVSLTPIAAVAAEPVVPVATPLTALHDGPPARSTGSLVGPASLGLVGVAALGVGSYLGWRAIQAKEDEGRHCPSGRCDATALSDYNDAHGSSAASTVVFGIGLASMAGAATWWLLGAPGSPPRATASATRVFPVIAPGRAGIAIQGDM